MVSNQRSTKEQVKSGFRRAFGWILGCAWLALVYLGIGNAFGTDANFSEGHHPARLLGYLLLAVAGAIFVATADRWKRVFPGIMVAATLGCLIEFERGHSTADSSVLIPRSVAFVQLALVAGVTLLSFTFKKRPLDMLDRIALLAFAASIYPGGEEVWHQEMPLALMAGAVCVLAAWAYHRAHHRRNAPRQPDRVIA